MKHRSKAITSILLLVITITISPFASASFMTVVQFPSSSLDTWSILHMPYMWNSGDYIEGTRNLGPVTDISAMRIHLVIVENYLNGAGKVDIDVYLNDIRIGSFSVYEGEFVKDVELNFPHVPTNNGDVKIKYNDTNTVPPALGSIAINGAESTVEFNVNRPSPVGGTLFLNNSPTYAVPLVTIAALVCIVSLAHKKETL
jgi:hypothetical protein